MAAAKTKADLRTKVRTLTNIFSSAILTDEEIDDELEREFDNLCTGEVEPWPWLVDWDELAVVAGDPNYDLPETCRDVMLVNNRTDGTMGRTLSRLALVDAMRTGNDEGDPAFYVIVGNSISFFPTPVRAETLTVVFRTTTPDFSDDTDTPPFDPEFHNVLAYGAAITILAERNKSDAKLQRLGGKYADLYQRMKVRYKASMDHKRIVFRGSH